MLYLAPGLACGCGASGRLDGLYTSHAPGCRYGDLAQVAGNDNPAGVVWSPRGGIQAWRVLDEYEMVLLPDLPPDVDEIEVDVPAGWCASTYRREV
ncbi:MAG: hypothetical protein IPK16_03430 [Anaerolineales bacterium]|nr:hypothetical protein [Anaerolineales bacterium]